MVYHPTILIVSAVFGLVLSLKYHKIFITIALGYPIIVLIFFYNQIGSILLPFFGIEIIAEFSESNKLIGFAFLFVLFASNMYALGRDKKYEIILGSSYGAFAFSCLLAGDLISIFVSLELMMLSSSLIIFIGCERESLRSAKKYFMTHLISSKLILIGIIYLINKSGVTSINEIAPLALNAEYSRTVLSIMLVGFIINVAAFPFSGWMVNYYPKASASGFLYLISFTTKVSVVLFLKLFAGSEALKFIAVIMVLYSSAKALTENSLLSLLCHLSIIQMGFMLIGISQGSNNALLATSIYLFVHIIYKSLLSLACATLIDYYDVTLCSELKRIKTPAIQTAFVVGIAIMINIPLSTTWYAKAEVSNAITHNWEYYSIIFVSLVTICVIPVRQYFDSTKSVVSELNIYTKISLYYMTFITLVVGFLGNYLPVIKDISRIDIFGGEVVKQLAIITIAALVILFIKFPRKQHTSLNLIEWIGEIFLISYLYCQSYFIVNDTQEPWSPKSLEKQIFNKLALIHNQQTAIFFVCCVFLLILVSLKIY